MYEDVYNRSPRHIVQQQRLKEMAVISCVNCTDINVIGGLAAADYCLARFVPFSHASKKAESVLLQSRRRRGVVVVGSSRRPGFASIVDFFTNKPALPTARAVAVKALRQAFLAALPCVSETHIALVGITLVPFLYARVARLHLMRPG
jgi:hypothetical protein